MPISKGHKNNFQTLCDARDNRDLCIMECTSKATGEIVIVVCAAYEGDDGQINMVPLAKLFDSDPYEEVLPINDWSIAP